MKSGHNIVGIVLLGVVLSVAPVAVQAEHSPSPSDVMKTDSLTDAQKYNFQSDNDKQQNVNERKGDAKGGGLKTIKGQLFRVDDAYYFVKAKDGSEVRLHTDMTTSMKGKISKGDQIEAMVNEENHALMIQAVK